MKQHTVRILTVHNITHDVRVYRIEKPSGYQFIPGQATEVSINKEGWTEEKRPFTFTSLNEWPYLEFTIKSYHDHNGVTKELYQLKPGDELIIRDIWGAIAYKEPGYFLAGGAGITPFVAILRQLHHQNVLADNKLFFSNKTLSDIIYHNELDTMLENNVIYTLTREQHPNYLHGPINQEFITKYITDFSKPFYICGPDKMVTDLTHILTSLGASPDAVVFEQ
ncbi:hypothetical protein SAMN05421788_106103 [Filimonas lacunae]|uniref:FAD-binding FR-type domain-containing protein n=1 Tax=Filimonas lacunae TaxID=477680 RepID=A0A173MF28_9BACT|nr:FAD-binding oxidoreductase [Filimonas lacunae]BAV06031.1 ferredoxin reductase [Filimonas lacunae]SIT24316.1 hypothetical protein SAMN05421788_106103 [Filimonas lacunae]